VPVWEQSDPSAIAFLYLACGRIGDGELVEAELIRIVERIGQWMPGATREQLHEVLGKATELLRSAPDEVALAELVEVTAERLHDVLAEQERERLVTELIGLVQADGDVDIGETDFVLAVARKLGIHVAVAES
jgi:uncharacterized tellurite resistance protein B-like protein